MARRPALEAYFRYARPVSGEEWIDAEWDGTLLDGLTPDDVATASGEQFGALPGRARVGAELDELATILGGTVQYTDAVSESSEQHLTIGRVHIKISASAFDFLTQLTGLVINIALHSPAGVVPALQLLRTIKRSVSLLSPEELSLVKTVAECQRKDQPYATADLGPVGARLLRNGVLEDREGQTLVAF